MNKTININLGGLPFTMDDTAFNLLEQYISSIKKHFSTSVSYEEIISDIEIRLGELMHEKLAERAIVTLVDVEYAIKTMGRPEEFGAESIDMPFESDEPIVESTENDSTQYRTGKKLFRNMQQKKIGGVCAGLAAYFGIQNANWVRLAFILFTISGGFGIALYLIMWIFIPQAKTAADYLAMKGEKITVTNIAEFLEKEINNISTQINDFTGDLTVGSKDGKKKAFQSSAMNIDLEETFRTGFQRIGEMLKPILKFLGVVALIFLGVIWVSLTVGYIIAWPILSFISSGSYLVNIISILNSIALFAVPVVLIIFAALKLLFKTKISRNLKQSLIVFWFTNLICLIILSASTFKEYSNKSTTESRFDLGALTGDQVHLISKSTNHRDGRIQLGDLRLGNDDQLEVDHDFKLNLLKSDNDQWSVVKKVRASGSNTKEAKLNAECVDYNFVPLTDSKLEIPTYFSISSGCKYRFQQVEADLYIPVGKTIVMNKDLKWRLGNVDFDKNQMKNGWKFVNDRQYKMTESGLICVDCTEGELISSTHSGEYEEYVDKDELPSDYLMQQSEETNVIAWNSNDELQIYFDKILAGSPDKIKFSKINFNITQSEDSLIKISEMVKYYSKSPIEESVMKDAYGFKTIGRDLILSDAGYIPHASAAMNPMAVITIALPVHTKVRFYDNVNDYDAEIMFDKDEISGGWRFMKNELLEMGAKGLKCINCN